MDDDAVSWRPVRGGRDLILVAELKRIDHAEDLVELTSGRGRVGQGETDRLFRIDHVHRADGEGDTEQPSLLSAVRHDSGRLPTTASREIEITLSSPSWSSLARQACPKHTRR